MGLIACDWKKSAADACILNGHWTGVIRHIIHRTELDVSGAIKARQIIGSVSTLLVLKPFKRKCESSLKMPGDMSMPDPYTRPRCQLQSKYEDVEFSS